MFSNPFLLAVVSMLTGLILGVLCCILAIMIVMDLHSQSSDMPSEEDLYQMCLWYEAEYGEGQND